MYLRDRLEIRSAPTFLHLDERFDIFSTYFDASFFFTDFEFSTGARVEPLFFLFSLRVTPRLLKMTGINQRQPLENTDMRWFLEMTDTIAISMD